MNEIAASKNGMKSNWTVGQRLLASHQETVKECRLNLHKGQWTFLQYLISNNIHLEKNFSDGFLS